MSYDIKPGPSSISEEDLYLSKQVIPLDEMLSKDFASTYKDANWLRKWWGSDDDGWFQSKKGIFIVKFPYFTCINRVRLETLCRSQEVFDRICPIIMYTMWKVTKRIRDENQK